MAQAVLENEKTKEESYILGNISDTEVILPDLIVGVGASGAAFKFKVGEVLDLKDYFSIQRLKKVKSIKDALKSDPPLLVACDSVDEKIIPRTRLFNAGIAPKNEFDQLLKEAKLKDIEDEERLKSQVM